MAQYAKWSPEKIKKQKEEAESGDGEFYKMKQGTNTVRILPPAEGADTPVPKTLQHFIKLPGSDKPIVFVCPRAVKKKCPACEKMDELTAGGNPADYEIAKEFKPKARYFANVIDRRNPEKGVQLMAVGVQVAEQLFALADNQDAGGDFSDPTEDGFDVIIERTGAGKNDTEYKVFAARKTSPLGNDDWLDQMIDLRKHVLPLPYEEIVKKLGAAASPRQVGPGGPSRQMGAGAGPARQAAKPGTKGAAKARSVADDNDDSDDSDE
jgi:hypothetical protein